MLFYTYISIFLIFMPFIYYVNALLMLILFIYHINKKNYDNVRLFKSEYIMVKTRFS